LGGYIEFIDFLFEVVVLCEVCEEIGFEFVLYFMVLWLFDFDVYEIFVCDDELWYWYFDVCYLFVGNGDLCEGV